jgi:hypothetical protein
MLALGRRITFGKYNGKTIEQIHFIDYGWLHWAMEQPNLAWIRAHVNSLPRIYPNKVKVHCGENHHAGCKTRIATRVSLPIDFYGKFLAHPAAAYYWCSECSIYSAGAEGGIIEFPLIFDSLLELQRVHAGKGNVEDFHKILREAYGIKRLTPEMAYKVFWE